MSKISLKAQWTLYHILSNTHPNKDFSSWVADESRDMKGIAEELLSKELVTTDSTGNYIPTQAGINYFRKSNPEVTDLIRQIKSAIPPNPKFSVIVESLSDTALVGLTYAIFGEIGRRGDPEKPEVVAWWQEKIHAFHTVLTEATPDSLWERQQKQNTFFGETSEAVKPKKATKK